MNSSKMTDEKAIERIGELRVIQREYMARIDEIDRYICRLKRLLDRDLPSDEEIEVCEDRKYLDAEIQQFIYR